MTQDEIREKIGLAPLEPGQRVQMDDQTDEMLFAQLEKTGFNAKDYEVLDSVNSEITCLADAERFENELLSKHKFALDRVLTDMEKAVLDMVVDNPSLPSNEIRKALEISIEDVNEIIQELQNIGALDVNFKPTQDAIDTIQKPDEEIFVAYKYIKRPDALRVVI